MNMYARRVAFVLVSGLVLVLGCTPGAPTAPANQADSAAGGRVLTMSIAREPTFIAGLAPLPAQQASDFYVRMFNAFLDLYDDQGHAVPYLAEALPVLNTDSWIIL